MAFSTVQMTLNTSGLPNVSATLTTSDYQDAVLQVQNALKSGGGLWTNTSVGGPLNQFVPATAILYVTVS